MANEIIGTYSRTAYVNIWDGTTIFQVEALMDTIDIDLGDKESEFKPTLAGGRIEIQKPEEDTMVTFEGWFMGIGDTDDTTPDGLITKFMGGSDTTVPFAVTNTRTRGTYQVFILWTDDTAATIANSSIASGANAMRFRGSGARLVSMKPSYTDKELKFTFKFRIPAYDLGGTGRIYWESTDGTGSMASLSTV
jgi:hypothetical protein